jgi:hypothetical protein
VTGGPARPGNALSRRPIIGYRRKTPQSVTNVLVTRSISTYSARAAWSCLESGRMRSIFCTSSCSGSHRSCALVEVRPTPCSGLRSFWPSPSALRPFSSLSWSDRWSGGYVQGSVVRDSLLTECGFVSGDLDAASADGEWKTVRRVVGAEGTVAVSDPEAETSICGSGEAVPDHRGAESQREPRCYAAPMRDQPV